jgi:hypothetical protein
MKKILAAILILALLIPAVAIGAGSVTVTRSTSNGGDIEIIIFSWVGDASDGSVPATSSSTAYPTTKAGYIIKVSVDPGACATCPTDNYDVTLTDDTTGADLMGGELANLSNTVSGDFVPKIGSAYGSNFAPNAFTLNLSNNSVNSATGTVYVYIDKE